MTYKAHALAILGIVALVASLIFAYGHAAQAAPLAETPTIYTASSTAISVTTGASVPLLATSSQRVAATVQAHNCATGATLFLSLNGNIAATANAGLSVAASSTQSFSKYPTLPIVAGPVNGITSTGSCTVLVTEWRRN